MDIKRLLADKGGIKLDIACGAHKQGIDWVGMDIQDRPGVDIIHDLNVHPWPLPDECVIQAVASHIMEHVPPVAFDFVEKKTHFLFIEFMDEVWRVMKYDGSFALAYPHGSSQGFLQDPTHCNQRNETVWAYFDPLEEATGGFLYQFYRPKPWKIVNLFWTPTGNCEVLLTKRRIDRSYYE
jgi:hypothetical protein